MFLHQAAHGYQRVQLLRLDGLAPTVGKQATSIRNETNDPNPAVRLAMLNEKFERVHADMLRLPCNHCAVALNRSTLIACAFCLLPSSNRDCDLRKVSVRNALSCVYFGHWSTFANWLNDAGNPCVQDTKTAMLLCNGQRGKFAAFFDVYMYTLCTRLEGAPVVIYPLAFFVDKVSYVLTTASPAGSNAAPSASAPPSLAPATDPKRGRLCKVFESKINSRK